MTRSKSEIFATNDVIRSNYVDHPWRNSLGIPLFKPLFYETYKETKEDGRSKVRYSLKRFDLNAEIDGEIRLLPSISRLYLETADPTEYEFATKYFEDWQHWKTLSQTKWFQPYLIPMREELELKLRSNALKKIKEIAFGKGPPNFTANKIILDETWKEKNSRGRPTNKEIDENLKKETEEAKKLANLLEEIEKGE